jgi:hypothetical protein
MLEFRARAFYESTMALHHMRNVIRSWKTQKEPALKETDIIDIEDAHFIIGEIDKLLPDLATINARLTQMSCTRLVGRLREPALTIRFGEVARSVESIIQRLSDELSMAKVLVIEAEKQKYYDPRDPAFGCDVTNKFISVLFELDEAGKCLALGRPTACVFHLMRIMEIGVRAIARCLQIPDPVKPAERNWGHILDEIWNGIAAKWPTTTDRMGGDGALFEELHASLDAVKNPWRNATMHVERKYTDDEAEHVFAAVRGFMMKLASRCDENGDPKA